VSGITVSIPTYNRCAFLKQAIESVLKQTYTDFTLLIVDNGSTDGTDRLVSTYMRYDSRVNYKRFERNHGPANNFYYSLFLPSTEFVTLLPDDDLLERDHLSRAMTHLRRFPRAALYCCLAQGFEGSDRKSDAPLYGPLWLPRDAGTVEFDARKNFAPILAGTPCALAGTVFRTSVITPKHFLNDPDFPPGDFVFLGRVALSGTIVFDPSVLSRYRWHKENHSVRIRRTFRAVAQHHYAIRLLASEAIDAGALDMNALHRSCREWSMRSAVDLVIAFAAIDSKSTLRRVGLDVFLDIVSRQQGMTNVNFHYRFVIRTVWLYLSAADIIDRIFACWFGPKLRQSPFVRAADCLNKKN
jgi:glycosyltransferase involved in cell wall biosynthesis